MHHQLTVFYLLYYHSYFLFAIKTMEFHFINLIIADYEEGNREKKNTPNKPLPGEAIMCPYFSVNFL